MVAAPGRTFAQGALFRQEISLSTGSSLSSRFQVTLYHVYWCYEIWTYHRGHRQSAAAAFPARWSPPRGTRCAATMRPADLARWLQQYRQSALNNASTKQNPIHTFGIYCLNKIIIGLYWLIINGLRALSEGIFLIVSNQMSFYGPRVAYIRTIDMNYEVENSGNRRYSDLSIVYVYFVYILFSYNSKCL